ncbi:hypothetical protein FVE85_4768 [Porphyridium purpureum]|uniref:Uncharacterized protein n=1 Tax=Porphyridium purpureum TaxID=35688 RepID=A0A5J4YQ50_PORPP|nr:hypothetical protein FVE85_4768 [Porphyridium purpureum]|eukprot:POR4334..scf236_6
MNDAEQQPSDEAVLSSLVARISRVAEQVVGLLERIREQGGSAERCTAIDETVRCLQRLQASVTGILELAPPENAPTYTTHAHGSSA